MSQEIDSLSGRRPWAIMFAAVTFALLIGGYAYYLFEADRIQKSRYQELAVIGNLKAEQIEQWRAERVQDLWRTAIDPFFKRGLEAWLRDSKNAALQEELQERLRVEQETEGFVDALLVDGDGRILLSPRPNSEALGISGKDAVHQALARSTAVLGNLHSSSLGRVEMDATVPLLNAQGRLLAVLLLRIDAGTMLHPLLESWPTRTPSAETLLVRREGEQVLFLNDLRHRPNSAFTMRIPLTSTDVASVKAILGEQGMFLGKDYRGKEILADLRPVPGSSWFLVTKVDESEIWAEIGHRGSMIALFGALFVLLAAAGSAYGYRQHQALLYRDLYRAEKEQREAHEQFRTTLYSIGDGVITTDTRGLVKEMNPEAERLTGWSEAEARGMSLQEVFRIFDEESRSIAENPVQRVLREGATVGSDDHALLFARSGTEYPVATSGAPIRDDAGAVIGVVLIFRDQTQEREARKALQRQQEVLETTLRRFYTVLSSLYSGIVLVSEEGKIEFVNQAFCDLCDVDQPPDDLRGLSAWEFFPSILDIYAERDKAAARVSEILDRQHPVRGEEVVMSDGRVYLRDFIPLLIDGTRYGRLWDLQDITYLKQSEARLQESEERYRSIVDNLYDVYYQTDAAGHLTFVSPSMARVFGYVPEEVIGMSLSEFSVDTSAWDRFRDLVTKQGFVDQFETEMKAKDGRLLWASTNARLLRNQDGSIKGTEGITRDVTDMKRAVEALKSSEAFLNDIIDQSPYAIWISDDTGTMIRLNAACRKTLKIHDNEVVGKYNLLLDNVIAGQGFMPLVRSVFEDGATARFEMRYDSSKLEHLTLREHTELFLDVTIFPVLGHDGAITNAVIQHVDVSDRKKAEAALRASEERFRAIFNTAAVGIGLTDRLGRFLEVNDTLSKWLGYTPEELRGRTVFDISHPADVAKSRESYDSLIQGQVEGYRIEKRYTRKEGPCMWVDISVAAIRDPGGAYIATVGVISDVTQRKQSEEDRLRLATAVEQAAEGITVTDADGIIAYANPAFERTTGYSRLESVGQNHSILKSGQHDDGFYRNLWETITGGRVWRGHLVNKKKDGSIFEEEATISPIKDDSGNIVNFVAVKRDVTKEVTLQRQLLQAQKMEAVGTLAGGIAHDFNNLLQVMLGYSELLLLEKSENHPDYADIRRIYQAARSGADLVRSLLTFSRKVEPHPRPMDVNHTIRQVEKLLHRTIPKMIDMRLHLAEDLKRVNADPAQVEQIIMNLALNARDAMGEGGTLTLWTENVSLNDEYCQLHVDAEPGDYVLIAVSDTGHGMEEETLAHIFEPFFTTKEVGRGTGLGLPMVYGIVKQHGGHITCSSETGKGTMFRVYLPAIASEPETS